MGVGAGRALRWIGNARPLFETARTPVKCCWTSRRGSGSWQIRKKRQEAVECHQPYLEGAFGGGGRGLGASPTGKPPKAERPSVLDAAGPGGLEGTIAKIGVLRPLWAAEGKIPYLVASEGF
jgi:hypothetical protein